MNKYLIIIIILLVIFLTNTNENMKAKTFLNTSFDTVNGDIKDFFNDIENVTNENLHVEDPKIGLIKKHTNEELILNKKIKLKLNNKLEMFWEKKKYCHCCTLSLIIPKY